MKTDNSQEPGVSGALGKLHLKSLLVPVDFSDFSLKALAYANFLAKQSEASLDLLHVVEPSRIPKGLKMSHADWEELMVHDAACSLRQLAGDEIEQDICVHTEVRVGNPCQEICNAASRQNQDLIVVGTHGRTGLMHLFLGSTAERVVRFAPCSVLVVRVGDQNDAGIAKPKKILVPMDFSRNSKLALEAALVLAKQFDAGLLLLNVIPTAYALGGYDGVDYGMLEGEMRESSEREFAEIVKKIGQTGVKAETRIVDGRPATLIVEAAKQCKVDLIAISTHGRAGFEHFVIGSTTEEVVRHADCNVLVFRKKKENQSAGEQNSSGKKP